MPPQVASSPRPPRVLPRDICGTSSVEGRSFGTKRRVAAFCWNCRWSRRPQVGGAGWRVGWLGGWFDKSWWDFFFVRVGVYVFFCWWEELNITDGSNFEADDGDGWREWSFFFADSSSVGWGWWGGSWGVDLKWSCHCWYHSDNETHRFLSLP